MSANCPGVSLTYDLQLHRHLSQQVGQVDGADVRPRVSDLSLLQNQGGISSLMQSLKVQKRPSLMSVSQAVQLPVVSQNQPAVPSGLVPPLHCKARCGQRSGRVDPEVAVQSDRFPESGLG